MPALHGWFERHLDDEAEVYSDGLGAFRAAIDLEHAHTVIVSAGGKAGTEAPGARWVNVVLGNLKRSLDGTHHAFRFFKYTQRYVSEITWRFNRRFRLEALVPRLLVSTADARHGPKMRYGALHQAC